MYINKYVKDSDDNDDEEENDGMMTRPNHYFCFT